MVGAFPVIKLGTLALKQIGKPVANFLKRRAKSNAFFRRYICLPPAQMYHFWETRLKLKLMGIGKPAEINKLSEEAAAELGAEMLGEIIMFGVGTACLLLEYRRQLRKESTKEEYLQHTLDDLTCKVNELMTLVEMQDAKLRELTRVVATKDTDHSVENLHTH